jgi:hypothetical protein
MTVRLAAFLTVFLALSAGAAQAATGIHYDVKATVAPAAGTIRVDVAIAAPAGSLGPEPKLVIGRSYTIRSADAGPAVKVEVTPTDQPFPGLQLIALHCAGGCAGPLKLKLAYDGPPNPSGDPPINLITPDLVELAMDSAWLPAEASFAGGFSIDAEITGLPRGAVVTAPAEISRHGDAVHIRRRAESFDLAFAAAPFDKTAVGDLEVYARDLKGPKTAVYRRQAPPALKFLQDWFGPVPGAPLRIVVVDRPRKSGYARPGYIVVTEGGEAPDANVGKFIAHEFSHAWWMRAAFTGEDHWLNESTAEYVSLRYVEQAFGKAALDEMLAKKRELAAKAGPLIGHGRVGEDELYAKGPLLLFDLEQRIGREKLDALLKAQAVTPTNTTRAFLDTLAASAGADEAARFEGALRS